MMHSTADLQCIQYHINHVASDAQNQNNPQLWYIFLWAMVMGSIFNALSNATRVCTNNVGCICRYTCALGRAQVDAMPIDRALQPRQSR